MCYDGVGERNKSVLIPSVPSPKKQKSQAVPDLQFRFALYLTTMFFAQYPVRTTSTPMTHLATSVR